jgi:protein TonB
MATPLSTPRYNWLRISGLSGSFIIHCAALLVLGIPVSQSITSAPVENATMITVISPPAETPVLPIPEEPKPVPIKPREKITRPVVPTAVPIVAAESAIPVPMPANIEPSAEIGEPNEVIEPEAPTAGSNMTLAYESITDPRYPPDSKRRGEQGVVMLRVHVGSDGLPQQVEIARSSGFFRLDHAAREAVMRWRFRPVQVNGRAVPARGLVPVAFNLERA